MDSVLIQDDGFVLLFRSLRKPSCVEGISMILESRFVNYHIYVIEYKRPIFCLPEENIVNFWAGTRALRESFYLIIFTESLSAHLLSFSISHSDRQINLNGRFRIELAFNLYPVEVIFLETNICMLLKPRVHDSEDTYLGVYNIDQVICPESSDSTLRLVQGMKLSNDHEGLGQEWIMKPIDFSTQTVAIVPLCVKSTIQVYRILGWSILLFDNNSSIFKDLTLHAKSYKDDDFGSIALGGLLAPAPTAETQKQRVYKSRIIYILVSIWVIMSAVFFVESLRGKKISSNDHIQYRKIEVARIHIPLDIMEKKESILGLN